MRKHIKAYAKYNTDLISHQKDRYAHAGFDDDDAGDINLSGGEGNMINYTSGAWSVYTGITAGAANIEFQKTVDTYYPVTILDTLDATLGTFLPKFFSDATEPTGLADGELVIWQDTDDSKVYLIFRKNSTNYKRELT